MDRFTKLPPDEKPSPFDLSVALRRAADVLTRDIASAGTGGLGPGDGLVPLSDNSPGGLVFYEATGESSIVRAGTDQIAVRGVLRSPLLALEPRDRATGQPFSGAGDSPGEIQSEPRKALLRVWARAAAPGVESAVLDAVASRLRVTPVPATAKRFFLVADAEGRYAVARIDSVDEHALSAGDCRPEGTGCFLALTLDFTDADAVAFNRQRDPGAPQALGALAAGGVFDEIVYFVARGNLGRPPDYFFASDPLTAAYPHPWLAAARSVGGGRFEISRVAEDIEDLQVAWGLSPDADPVWHGDRPGSPAPRPADLEDALGRPLLKAVRIALVAKSAARRPSGAPPVKVPGPIFNAPEPDPGGRGPAPVGWAADPARRLPFERDVRVITVVPRPWGIAPARPARAP